MKLLEAINTCLRGNGDQSINEPDELSAPSTLAKNAITRKRKELLSNGYAFNTDKIDLAVSTDGKVRVNRSYLVHMWPDNLTYRVDPDNDKRWVLWNKSNNDYHGDAVSDLVVMFDIKDYENLPETFGQWLAYEAAIEYYSEVNPEKAIPPRLINDTVRAHRRFFCEQPKVNLSDLSGWNALKRL